MTERPAAGCRDRGGFALLAMLAIIVGLAALVLVGNLAARDMVFAVQNRLSLARARWRAEGCLARARLVLDSALTNLQSGPWPRLDEIVHASGVTQTESCNIAVKAVGTAVDINIADSAQLHALFRAVWLPSSAGDSLTDAILDWRDADDIPRPLGAERDWYLQRGERPPRNGPFADIRELHLVRGYVDALGGVPGLDTLFTVEGGRIVPGLAPLTVVASLPGATDALLDRLSSARAMGESPNVGTAAAITDTLLRDARGATLIARAPDAWLLTATATAGTRGAPRQTVELKIRVGGGRAAIVRRRIW